MSENNSEKQEMSSQADTIQIQEWAHQYADLVCSSSNFKARVESVARGFGLTWARAKGFYFGEARRVEMHEYKAAKRALKRAHAEQTRKQLLATARHLELLDSRRYRGVVDEIISAANEMGVSNRALDEA